jgi:hypothetical protein
LRALNLELFTLPSNLEFLRDHQVYTTSEYFLSFASFSPRIADLLTAGTEIFGAVRLAFTVFCQ